MTGLHVLLLPLYMILSYICVVETASQLYDPTTRDPRYPVIRMAGSVEMRRVYARLLRGITLADAAGLV